MTAPANSLQAVQTYQQASLALLQNVGVFTSPELMNMKFRHFNKDYTSNLGDTITFSLTTRYSTGNGLVVTSFQPTMQRVENLVVGDTSSPIQQEWTAANVPIAFNASQIIFNVEAFIDEFGRSAVGELADRIQRNVAQDLEAQTYRFYGSVSGGSVINSYGQLAKALAKFANYGSATDVKRKVIIPDTSVPDIINNGLQQFAIDRNNMDANTWQIASTMNADFYMSNLLPTHYSGTVGDAGTQLTVTALSPDGTILTLSGGPASDAFAIRKYDILVLDYDKQTTGIQTLLYLTFVGHGPTQQQPQVKAVSDAASDGLGNIIVNVFPALIFDPTGVNPNRNLTSNPVTALGGSGVHVQVLPSHKCGAIMSGDAFYLGMPALPDQSPFLTANEYDPVTQVSIRLTKGAQYGGNTYGYIYDAIWGKKLVPEYSMRLIFPVDGGF